MSINHVTFFFFFCFCSLKPPPPQHLSCTPQLLKLRHRSRPKCASAVISVYFGVSSDALGFDTSCRRCDELRPIKSGVKSKDQRMCHLKCHFKKQHSIPFAGREGKGGMKAAQACWRCCSISPEIFNSTNRGKTWQSIKSRTYSELLRSSPLAAVCIYIYIYIESSLSLYFTPREI